MRKLPCSLKNYFLWKKLYWCQTNFPTTGCLKKNVWQQNTALGGPQRLFAPHYDTWQTHTGHQGRSMHQRDDPRAPTVHTTAPRVIQKLTFIQVKLIWHDFCMACRGRSVHCRGTKIVPPAHRPALASHTSPPSITARCNQSPQAPQTQHLAISHSPWGTL